MRLRANDRGVGSVPSRGFNGNRQDCDKNRLPMRLSAFGGFGGMYGTKDATTFISHGDLRYSRHVRQGPGFVRTRLRRSPELTVYLPVLR